MSIKSDQERYPPVSNEQEAGESLVFTKESLSASQTVSSDLVVELAKEHTAQPDTSANPHNKASTDRPSGHSDIGTRCFIQIVYNQLSFWILL